MADNLDVGSEVTPEKQGSTTMKDSPAEELKEKPKQSGRFIIAMIPLKKMPLPPLPKRRP
jgi:hypothetical protein